MNTEKNSEKNQINTTSNIWERMEWTNIIKFQEVQVRAF